MLLVRHRDAARFVSKAPYGGHLGSYALHAFGGTRKPWERLHAWAAAEPQRQGRATSSGAEAASGRSMAMLPGPAGAGLGEPAHRMGVALEDLCAHLDWVRRSLVYAPSRPVASRCQQLYARARDGMAAMLHSIEGTWPQCLLAHCPGAAAGLPHTFAMSFF